LTLRENEMIEGVYDIFNNAPLSMQTVAAIANEFERKKIIDLLYPLLLLYRLAFYKKLGQKIDSKFNSGIEKKANLTLEKIVDTMLMLNSSINMLEQNPNHLLLLLNILSKLP